MCVGIETTPTQNPVDNLSGGGSPPLIQRKP